ncbi:MAG: hypothetical protein MK008_04810 [Bdellovibrionales bacterium]|nr:hypothetical protein [Bdellovibrionales bacterium]
MMRNKSSEPLVGHRRALTSVKAIEQVGADINLVPTKSTANSNQWGS